MKIRFITLLLLLISAITFAQTAFTKATLDGLLNEYQTNPYAFFKRHCPPDFRYITTDGSLKFLPEVLERSINDKLLANQIQEQKIIQSGDVAVVSGIHVQERPGSDGTKAVRQIACTYTFQRQKINGSSPRWMFVASHQSNIASK